MVKPIPDQYPGFVPYICVHDAAAAIEYYKKVFGAVETTRMEMPDKKIGHAEIKIREHTLMLADEFPEMGAVGPKTVGGTPVTLMMYFEDVDAVVERAVAAGAKIQRPVENQFYGDRGGQIEDPFGHRWWIATHIEDVSDEEMNRRAQEKYGAGS